MRLLLLAAGLSLVLGLGTGATACRGRDAAAGDTAIDSTTPRSGSSLTLPVVGQPVRRGDLVLTVATTGQVRSDAVARLKAEAAGLAVEVLVIPGQRVARGQPILRLDPRPLDLAVQEAEAEVARAEVSYLDNIVPDSIVSGQPPSEERRRNALARSGLSAARVRLERAKLERERGVVVAPFEGVIERVNVATGERVSSGQDVATVVDLVNLRVDASVLEHDLPVIKVGGQALVSTAAAPGAPVTGRIAAVLPLVDSTTRAGTAVIRVKNPAGASGGAALRPGMYADVRLEATRLASRLIVPARAVIERDGRPLVFVVKGGRAQWVYVTPGRTNGADTEVLPDSASGAIPVALGDTVLVEGHLTLTHDAPVRLVADVP